MISFLREVSQVHVSLHQQEKPTSTVEVSSLYLKSTELHVKLT